MSAEAFVAHFAPEPRIVARVSTVTFDEGCWLYKAHLPHYPRLSLAPGGKYLYIHRLSLAIKLGMTLDELAGREAAHQCDRPRCVNPDHLFSATHAQNMADMGRKGRWVVPSLSGDDSPHSVMSKTEVMAVLAAHAGGESLHSLSRRLPVSRRTLQFWTRGTVRYDAYAEFHGLEVAS